MTACRMRYFLGVSEANVSLHRLCARKLQSNWNVSVCVIGGIIRFGASDLKAGGQSFPEIESRTAKKGSCLTCVMSIPQQ